MWNFKELLVYLEYNRENKNETTTNSRKLYFKIKQCSAGTIRTDQQIYRPMLSQTKIQEDKYLNII